MWTTAKLQDVCNIFSGNSINAKEKEARYTHNSQGTPYVATKDVGFDGVIDYSNGVSIPLDFLDSFKTAPVGATLVCAEGGSAGRKIAITDREICFVNKLFSLCPNQDLHQKYLLYYTMGESFQKQFKDGLSGLIGGVSLSKIKAFDISFPSLYEQQRIVAILDQAFADIEKARANAEKNLKNARELFDSYLNQVFSQRGEGWVEDSVGNMAEHNLGKMLDKQKNKGDLRPYLRNLSVRWFDFNLDDILKMRFEDREVDRYSVRKGDLMICEGGYPGRAAIWDNSETMFYQKAIHRVRFKNTVYNKWLLYYLYLSDSNETLRTHFTGAGIQHFTGKALGALRLAFPPERDAYVILADIEKLHDLVRELEQPYERKLASLDELKKSLLQKAFSGELTKTEDMVA
jgi:type I restriction enzyme S subunit